MSARRILVVLAVAMGITALSVAVAPPSREGAADRPQGPVSGSANAPDLDAGIVSRTLSAEAPRAETVTVALGSTLRLMVEADALDSIQIESLELFAGVAPESPAHFEFLADRPGTFDVRLMEADRIVGRIEVSPRG